jgi:hypothetical protein
VSPLAEVEGECITNEAVENALGATLRRLERQIYETKRQKLEGLINERLLAREAAKRGVSRRRPARGPSPNEGDWFNEAQTGVIHVEEN